MATEKLNCQSIDNGVLYFDLQDLTILPSWGQFTSHEGIDPETFLKVYGFPDELAGRCIFYFQLNTIEFQEYQEWYLDHRDEDFYSNIKDEQLRPNPTDKQCESTTATAVAGLNISSQAIQSQNIDANSLRKSIDTDEFINFPQSFGISPSKKISNQSIGFLDIETTGFSKTSNIITTAVLITKEEAYVFVNGKNLDALPSFLDKCQILITFNGRSFDIPFIESQLGWQKKCDDIDLMLEFRRLGIRGGQKKIEKEFGLTRDSVDMDGRLAIKLWSHYMNTSDPGALSSLLAYNYDDSLSLCSLLNILIEKDGGSESFALNEEVRSNPYKIDSSIVEQYSW